MLKSNPTTNYLAAALLTLILAGCTTPVRIHPASEASLQRRLPTSQGLVYGRIVVRGWSPTVQGEYGTSVEFRNRTTEQTFTHRLNALGDFHWLLPAGSYEVTDVWAGSEVVSQQAKDRGIYFKVSAGGAVYLGDLFVQLPTVYSNGTVNVFDDFTTATRYLHRRYPLLNLARAPARLLFTIPTSRR